jgi:hypothetical protein
MFTLVDMALLMLAAAFGAWLWHGHGVRERALSLVAQHCDRQDLQLLDDNVAFRRFTWLVDAKGRKRFARVYGFEFTVTGEQRHPGSIAMFGMHLAHIELAPYPIREPVEEASVPIDEQRSAQVIQLSDWRRQHGTGTRN